ncbi:MAG: cytochrome b/b6 domain-containing protein [Nitrospirae bacterium]|nr:cytochrome b/b6 domain-containing protein [Nitrospirota bacterium]
MHTTQEKYIKRFGPLRIAEHWLNALTFILLVVTGLSQKFHNYELSQWVIMSFGGIDTARLVHRYSGIMLAVLTLQHVLVASFGVIALKWQPSMIIHKKDFQDAIANIRYYLGLQEHGASCDRFDYKQKFEYWGVVVGGMLMIGTGLALWFPTIVTHYLPGELVPVAKALHTNEALLAVMVIIIWHIYNAIFSPEVIPLDTVIFTGKISLSRMLHEHPVEYRRLSGEPPAIAEPQAIYEPGDYQVPAEEETLQDA